MAAQPSYTPLVTPMAVIGPQFCAPYPVDLTIMRKALSGNFAVADINGNIIFKVKEALLSLRDRYVLLDSAGNPIITFQEKIMSEHWRWKAYRGESTDSKDLLFSVVRSSKTQLDVFFAGNTKEDVCDFKIKGSWSKKSCVIYLGESSNIVAQLHRKGGFKNMVLGKDTFMVTVYPHVDSAFIVALNVILNKINEDISDAEVLDFVGSVLI